MNQVNELDTVFSGLTLDPCFKIRLLDVNDVDSNFVTLLVSYHFISQRNK